MLPSRNETSGKNKGVGEEERYLVKEHVGCTKKASLNRLQASPLVKQPNFTQNFGFIQYEGLAHQLE